MILLVLVEHKGLCNKVSHLIDDALAFTLQQLIEMAYAALLLVHTNYKPHEYHLFLLRGFLVPEIPEADTIFPITTKA